MPGQVKFVVDAQTAAAVSSLLRIVDTQKQMQQGQRDITRESLKSGQTLSDLKDPTDSVASAATKMVGAFMGLKGVSEIVDGLMEELKKARGELMSFHTAAGASTLARYISDQPG